MQADMNLKIKFRESFRPFAPSVLAEHVAAWFDLGPGHESPYMLLVAPVCTDRRVAISPERKAIMENDPDLCRRASVVRSQVPAVTHVDGSARLQTVDAGRNPRYHRLLTAFYEQTGCPILVNTSFNVRGEPIVCTPEEAYRCFLATDMDALVMEDVVVTKTPATRCENARARRAEYLAQFQPD
jgi:carbamoyltransferase